MADKKIFIQNEPQKPDVPLSPFDWTFTNNITGRFGKVNVVMCKYLPPKSKLDIQTFFAFDMQPFVFPVQTNVRCHTEVYTVPLRILWKDFEDFVPQLDQNGLPLNTSNSSPFVVPYIKRPTGWNPIGSLAEQIGCCNVKYSGVSAFIPAPSNRAKFFFPTNANNEGLSIAHRLDAQGNNLTRCIYCDIDSRNYVLHNRDGVNGTVNGVTFQISHVVDSSTTVPSFSNTFKLYVLTPNDINQSGFPKEYKTLYVSDFFTRVQNGTTFNSSESNVFLQLTNSDYIRYYTIDGHTFSERQVLFHVHDENFFSLVTRLGQAGVPITLALSCGDNIPYFVPNNQDIKTFVSVQSQNILYDRVKPDSSTQGEYELEYEQQTDVLSRNLGATYSWNIGVMTVEKSIDTRYDSVDGADPVETVCALPFRAVEFIHNYFKRNPRIDPFFKNGVPSYNKFITNDEGGADTTTPVDTWNALYEYDYFTTCVKEPQFGNAPLVGVTVNDLGTEGILHFSDSDTTNEYTVKLDIGTDGQVLPLTAYKDSAEAPNIHRLREIIDFGISINDLRNVSTFQRMLERLQRTSYRYANVIYEFFGVHPPIGDHFPQYQGGVTRNMMVNKITQMAETAQKKLGQFTGEGKFRYPADKENPEHIKFMTSEPCYVIAIQYFTVTPTYSQYFPKHLSYKDPLDFYINPEFAFMGPQPVFAKEVAGTAVPIEEKDTIFGYNRPYAELFSNVDEVHGLFKTDLTNYLLQRFFATTPILNKSFIEVNSADLTNIFSVTQNTDKIFGQVMFKVHAELPAPRSYQPRSI